MYEAFLYLWIRVILSPGSVTLLLRTFFSLTLCHSCFGNGDFYSLLFVSHSYRHSYFGNLILLFTFVSNSHSLFFGNIHFYSTFISYSLSLFGNSYFYSKLLSPTLIVTLFWGPKTFTLYFHLLLLHSFSGNCSSHSSLLYPITFSVTLSMGTFTFKLNFCLLLLWSRFLSEVLLLPFTFISYFYRHSDFGNCYFYSLLLPPTLSHSLETYFYSLNFISYCESLSSCSQVPCIPTLLSFSSSIQSFNHTIPLRTAQTPLHTPLHLNSSLSFLLVAFFLTACWMLCF